MRFGYSSNYKLDSFNRCKAWTGWDSPVGGVDYYIIDNLNGTYCCKTEQGVANNYLTPWTEVASANCGERGGDIWYK